MNRKSAILIIIIVWQCILTLSAQTSIHRVIRQTDTLALKGWAEIWKHQYLKGKEYADSKYPGAVRIMKPEGDIQELQSMDERNHPWFYGTSNLNAAKTVSTDKVWPGGSAGLSLTGNGFTLGIWDGGKVRTTHQEFGGRALQADAATSLSSHATHVSGTMLASGVNPLAIGMAGQANLNAYDWNLDVMEMSNAAASGLLLSNHSYKHISGWNGNYWYGDTTVNRYEDYKFGFYAESSRQFDLICNAAPYYLPVIAASNDRNETNGTGIGYVWNGSSWVWSNTVRPPDGPWDCIPTFCGAKNVLTVGNIQDIPGAYSSPSSVVLVSSSSCGPTDDGRIKPDIVANGSSVLSSSAGGDASYTTSTGTSMASPNVTGSLVLLQEHFENLRGGLLRAATLKGLVIASADEAGPSEGPDYMYGWGLLNTQKAASWITQEGNTTFIRELTLDEGQEFLWEVYATGNEPFITTIVWNDPAGEVPVISLDPTDLILKNDLDLRISQDTIQWFPYILDPLNPSAAAAKGDNFRDNVEKIMISPVTAGKYTIRVSHKAGLISGYQPFSMIISGIQNNAPVSFTALPLSSDSIRLNWESEGTDTVLVAFSETGLPGSLADSLIYSVGDTLPGGGQVVYRGTDSVFVHSGLDPAKLYSYKAWNILNIAPEYSTAVTTQARTFCESKELPFMESLNTPHSPECWNIQKQGNALGWEYSETGHAGGDGNEYLHTWEDLYNNYTYGIPQAVSRLILPALNTLGMDSLTLRFRNHFKDSYGYGLTTVTAKIQTSSDGVNWTDEGWSFSSRNGDLGPEWRAVPILNHLNDTHTYISFTLSGDLYDFWLWAIDDVQVYEGPSGLWTGNVSEMWGESGNWSDNLIPDTLTPVLIPGGQLFYPILQNDYNTPLKVGQLYMDTGSTFILDTLSVLTVSSAIQNHAGDSALLLREGASLIHTVSGAEGCLERFISGGSDYHYISSPVFPVRAGDVFPGWAYLRYYDESDPVSQWISLAGQDTLQPGRGYASWLPEGDVTARFSGLLQAGEITVSGLTYTADKSPQYDGYNLVGNPYPSGIDLESSGIVKTDLDATFYMWDPGWNGGVGGYATYTPGIGGTNGGSRYLGPAQGFFVKVNNPGDSGSLSFLNHSRSYLSAGFFKTGSTNLFKMILEKQGFRDECLIGFREGATYDFDSNTDAYKLQSGATAALFALSNQNTELAVQITSTRPDRNWIPLHIRVYTTDTFTLKAEGLDAVSAFYPLELQDMRTGEVHNLLLGSEVRIIAAPDDSNPRFRLWLGTANAKELREPDITLLYSPPCLTVQGTDDRALTVEIYDIQGRLMKRQSHETGDCILLSLKKGFYIVRIYHAKGTISEKIFVY